MLSQIPEGIYSGYQIHAHHFEEAIGRQRKTRKKRTTHKRNELNTKGVQDERINSEKQ
jgi:hypothetical protein